MRPHKRLLHELPYTEMVKSGDYSNRLPVLSSLSPLHGEETPFPKTSFTAKRAKSTCTNRRALIKIVQVLNKTVVFTFLKYCPNTK